MSLGLLGRVVGKEMLREDRALIPAVPAKEQASQKLLYFKGLDRTYTRVHCRSGSGLNISY